MRQIESLHEAKLCGTLQFRVRFVCFAAIFNCFSFTHNFHIVIYLCFNHVFKKQKA